MDRRVALGALWALFAAASVGVGFGAAGLVGDPFTDPADITAGSVVSSTGSATGSPAPTGSATGSPAPTGSATGSPSGSASGSSQSGDPTSGPSSSRPPGTTTEVRGISTRGGYVSASCRDGLVSVSASPAVGWAIDDVDSGRVENARVRFEGSGDSDQRVEVRASCVGGVPRFAVEDRDRGSDDSGGSGSSGSGGGDD